jgi:hypothetical protein
MKYGLLVKPRNGVIGMVGALKRAPLLEYFPSIKSPASDKLTRCKNSGKSAKALSYYPQ